MQSKINDTGYHDICQVTETVFSLNDYSPVFITMIFLTMIPQ